MGHPDQRAIAVGMEFKEVLRGMGRQARIVEVTQTTPYRAMVKVLSGPGIGRSIQKWRKALADPAQWRYLGDNAEAVQP